MGDNASPRILTEFCLTDEGKQRLQAQLEADFTLLQLEDPEAEKRLQATLEAVLPQNEALHTIKETLAGRSPYMIKIHNLPELKGLETERYQPGENQTYSFFIGNALYALGHAQSVWSQLEARKWRRQEDNHPNSFVGGGLHRDFMVGSNPKTHGKQAEYIIFSCPHNLEHAVTEIIDVKKAVMRLAPEIRQRMEVVIGRGRYTLEDALPLLEKFEKGHVPVKQLNLFVGNDPADTAAFHKAIDDVAVKVDIQPGELLLVNENALFHRARAGNIENIPSSYKHFTRLLVHNAGAPIHSLH